MNKQIISHKFEKLNKNLNMCTTSFDGEIASISLFRQYDFGKGKRLFEIFFYGDIYSKLAKEEHIIDGKVQKIYDCDTSISPNMNEVYRYLKGEKIR